MLCGLSGILTIGFHKDCIRYTNDRIEKGDDIRIIEISVDIYKMNSEIYYGAYKLKNNKTKTLELKLSN